MPYCPKCRYEYDNGYTHCTDCGAALVDKPPSDLSEYGPAPHFETKKTLLIETKNNTESSKVVSLLNRNAIPAYVKDDDMGGYITDFGSGLSSNGNRIYVEEDSYGEASEIIGEVFPEVEDENPEAAAALEQEVRKKAAAMRKWIGIGLIVFGSIYLLWYFFR